jgi:hypothetical protein
MENMKLIESKTVGAGGIASIEFTSIPQTYTDLIIQCSIRHTEAVTDNWVKLTFNNLGGTSNDALFLRGTGTNVASSVGINTDFIRGIISNGASSTSSIFASNTVYISNYTSSDFKSVSIDGAQESNTSTNYMPLTAGFFESANAITSVQLTAYSGTLVEHSTVHLYGVSSIITGGAKAYGGYVTEDADYWYHTFLASGTFTPTQSLSCDYLIVAGGAGGGYDGGGGGGAGGFRAFTSQSLSATAYSVTVGSGGAGATSAGARGASGGTSTFNSNSSSGGGGGGSDSTSSGASGGSGGGVRVNRGGNSPGSGNAGSYSPSEGNAGGSSTDGTAAGGGGGAGASGTAGTSGGAGGIGNNAYSSWALATLTGDQGYYAGGGGGVGTTSDVGAGGLGGGGQGARQSQGGAYQTNGRSNTGGGGGGGTGSISSQYNGANGGSGIIIVRYAK